MVIRSGVVVDKPSFNLRDTKLMISCLNSRRERPTSPASQESAAAGQAKAIAAPWALRIVMMISQIISGNRRP